MPLISLHEFREGQHSETLALTGGGLALEPGATAGEWISPIHSTTGPFDWAVASWNGEGEEIEVQVRVTAPGGWSPWFSFGPWCLAGGERHSIEGQRAPGIGHLSTDTLLLEQPARAWQMRVLLRRAALKRAWLSTALAAHRSPEAPHRAAWGKDLDVPRRSQMIYPDGGKVWCSPTSLAMVMAFWGHKESIPEQVVPGVYDHVYNGHGNWPFNTAYAGVRGFAAYVDRFDSFTPLERLIAASVPVIASVAYQKEWLPNAPIDQTRGHILVVRGFTPGGDVIVNDPAASNDEGVRLVYRRHLFQRAWLDRGGVVYVITPEPLHALHTSNP